MTTTHLHVSCSGAALVVGCMTSVGPERRIAAMWRAFANVVMAPEQDGQSWCARRAICRGTNAPEVRG
jgi:hypothetical protein